MRSVRNFLVAMAAIVSLLGTGAAHSAPVTVYANDFDSGAVFGAGVTGGLSGITTTTGVEGFAGLGPTGNQFGGSLLWNFSGGDTTALTGTTVTLLNLPAHDSVDVNFLLAVIDSWDSTDGAANATLDFFNVIIDGVTVVSNTFNTASGTVNQPVGADIGGGIQQRGFNLGPISHQDQAFDASSDPSLTVAHTLSSLTVTFIASGPGWQGGLDES